MRQENIPKIEAEPSPKQMFRRLARKLHPDVAGNEATAAMQELNDAYKEATRDKKPDPSKLHRMFGLGASTEAGPGTMKPLNEEQLQAKIRAYHTLSNLFKPGEDRTGWPKDEDELFRQMLRSREITKERYEEHFREKLGR